MPLYAGSHGFPETIESIENLIAIARRVGDGLIKMQPHIASVAKGVTPASKQYWVEQKPDGSWVTSADKWANAQLIKEIEALTGAKSRVSYISEEGDAAVNRDAAKGSDTYVIDPLDCTGAYMGGYPNWSINIGYLHNREISGGLVYYPAYKLFYYTADNGKSMCRDEMLGIAEVLSDKSSKQVTRVVAPPNLRSVFEERHGATVERVDRHFRRLWEMHLQGGAEAAEHGAKFYAWDIAAPAAISRRAGIVYADRNGKPLDYLARRVGHHAFELPRAGFIAAPKSAIRKLVAA